MKKIAFLIFPLFLGCESKVLVIGNGDQKPAIANFEKEDKKQKANRLISELQKLAKQNLKTNDTLRQKARYYLNELEIIDEQYGLGLIPKINAFDNEINGRNLN